MYCVCRIIYRPRASIIGRPFTPYTQSSATCTSIGSALLHTLFKYVYMYCYLLEWRRIIKKGIIYLNLFNIQVSKIHCKYQIVLSVSSSLLQSERIAMNFWQGSVATNHEIPFRTPLCLATPSAILITSYHVFPRPILDALSKWEVSSTSWWLKVGSWPWKTPSLYTATWTVFKSGFGNAMQLSRLVVARGTWLGALDSPCHLFFCSVLPDRLAAFITGSAAVCRLRLRV